MTIKNESCHVCDENFFFTIINVKYKDRFCYMHFDWSEITSAKVTQLVIFTGGTVGVSIFKEASGQGYVTIKVELVSLACEDVYANDGHLCFRHL